MDRAAAKEALARFTNAKTLTANQLEFVNLIVDHLTEHGVVEPARLYESPFTDLTPRGPDGLFKANEMDELMRTLHAVRATAIAA
jgi:type I restriction enzyme R subunit